jgi:hypothetical protein
MIAFILMVLLAFGTSILVYRQTRQDFSVVFLIIFLLLFSLTEKRVHKTNEKFAQLQSSLQDE